MHAGLQISQEEHDERNRQQHRSEAELAQRIERFWLGSPAEEDDTPMQRPLRVAS